MPQTTIIARAPRTLHPRVRAVGLCLLLGICFMTVRAEAMIYRPARGAMWDPSVIYHDGMYYAFMMYDQTGGHGLSARHCFLATSEDGVHWKDEGVVNEEREARCRFFKCFVGRCGDKFIMDHGVWRPQGQDTLRFYESTDLRNWKFLFNSHPDPNWYNRRGRWDCMYFLPKEEGNPEAGFWGYCVATPKQDLPRGLGMMQSANGTEWKVISPPKVEWGSTPGKCLEFAGCERIGGKYYLIGGYSMYMANKGYSMYTFIGNDPRGPFRPDVEAFRLCGTSSRKNVTWLAALARGKDGELLISNYASPTGDMGHPWMLPLRKAVVDMAGHLRMGWWKGNKALKGTPLPLSMDKIELNGTDKADGYDVAHLDTAIDAGQGIVFEGRITARTTGDGPTAGFFMEESTAQAMAVQLGIGEPQGRETHVGRLTTPPDGKTVFASEDATGKGCATVTGIEDGREHTFRLLVRVGFFELYIDDLLVQTFHYQHSSGKMGFVVRGAKVVFSDLKAWKMSLPAVAGFRQ